MGTEPFYRLNNIKSHNAEYNIIYGERSNGKTTSVLEEALKRYIESDYKSQLAIIRRWEDDFKGKKGDEIFETINNLGWVETYTRGKWNSIMYYSYRWYLCKYEDGKRVKRMEEPFAFGFALTKEEHYKMTSYPNVDIILFDEFIARNYYLPEEFIKFQNLLSTIIRLRDNVVIYMCGNTINKFCPYFAEMGLKGVKNQKKGTIDIYSYGDNTLKVAVEYSDFPSKKKASNKYFAFNNPKLEMITHGGWEIDIYPHLPKKYLPKNVVYQFYILFDDEKLHGEIISIDDTMFIYLHRKTTPIKEDTERLVYKQTPDYRRNYRTNILKPYGKADKIIKQLVNSKKIFYQDNEVGEIMRNYLIWCMQD